VRCRCVSVIEVISGDFNDVGRFEVLLDVGFAAVLFLVFVHVVDAFYACLYYYLRAGEAGVVGRVQSAPVGLAYAHFDDRRLFCVQAETLVQLFAFVVVAAVAAHFVAGGDALGSAVVAGGDHAVVLVDDDCAY
jgi:hypothetical protein